MPDSGGSSRGRGGNTSRGGGSRGGGARGGAGAGGRRGKFGGALTKSDDAEPSSNAEAAAPSHDSASSHAVPSAPSSHAHSSSSSSKGKGRGKGKGAGGAGISTASASAPSMPPTKEALEEAAAADAELCFICAEPVKLYSVSPCNHRTCHICALRLRALYKKKECTFCKSPTESLIFTTSPDRDFLSFAPEEIPEYDKRLGVRFETAEAKEETIILLRYNCPDPSCDEACQSWVDLKSHVDKAHGKFLCDLCVENKKIFAHEHTLHTQASRQAHIRKEHGYCAFCKRNFYSDDELFVHMRDRHEQCHLCKARGTEEERWKYYKDYEMLERHFQQNHFLCPVKECLDKKFIVFDSEMDFKAHQVAEHSNLLSSKERKDALRVEANFSFEEAGGSRGRGQGGRQRGGADEREAAAAAPPAGPQGRRVVPGAAPPGSGRRAGFGGSLTPSTGAGGSQQQTAASAQLQQESLGGTGSNDALVQRHQLYLSRVMHILKDSAPKLASFRANVKMFRAGEMSARDLVDSILALVEDLEDSGVVVTGLADLLDSEEKKRALLGSWNALRVERTQFPSLVPGSASSGAGASSSRYAGAAAGSVQSVKGKSFSNSAVWANVERAASASSGHGAGRPVALRESFPTLVPANKSSKNANQQTVPGSAGHWNTATTALRQQSAFPSLSSSSASGSGTSTPVIVSIKPPQPYTQRASSTTSAAKAPVKLTPSAFPDLPSSSQAAALAAKKRTLLANSKGKNRDVLLGSGSGQNTPSGANGNGPSGSSPSSGTSTPWASANNNGSSQPSTPSVTGLSAAMFEGLNLGGEDDGGFGSSRASSNGGAATPGSFAEPQQSGAGSKKKKQKQVLASFGGLHRG